MAKKRIPRKPKAQKKTRSAQHIQVPSKGISNKQFRNEESTLQASSAIEAATNSTNEMAANRVLESTERRVLTNLALATTVLGPIIWLVIQTGLLHERFNESCDRVKEIHEHLELENSNINSDAPFGQVVDNENGGFLICNAQNCNNSSEESSTKHTQRIHQTFPDGIVADFDRGTQGATPITNVGATIEKRSSPLATTTFQQMLDKDSGLGFLVLHGGFTGFQKEHAKFFFDLARNHDLVDISKYQVVCMQLGCVARFVPTSQLNVSLELVGLDCDGKTTHNRTAKTKCDPWQLLKIPISQFKGVKANNRPIDLRRVKRFLIYIESDQKCSFDLLIDYIKFEEEYRPESNSLITNRIRNLKKPQASSSLPNHPTTENSDRQTNAFPSETSDRNASIETALQDEMVTETR